MIGVSGGKIWHLREFYLSFVQKYCCMIRDFGNQEVDILSSTKQSLWTAKTKFGYCLKHIKI